jgi:hypothetical protein
MPVFASKKNLEVSGIAEVQDAINESLVAMGSSLAISRGKKIAITRRAFQILNKTLYDSAALVKGRGVSNAQSLKWPREAVAGFFAYYDPDKPRKTTALAGISKRKSMAEWRAGKSKSPRAKAPPGTKISMSLATMYEYGTSKMAKRPALRPAITSMKGAVLDRLKNGYMEVLNSLDYTK